MNWLRWLVIVVLFYMIIQVLRGLMGGERRARVGRDRRSEIQGEPKTEELVRDPQCGIYFPRSEGLASLIDGRVHYFHNQDCRDKYLAARTRGPKGGQT